MTTTRSPWNSNSEAIGLRVSGNLAGLITPGLSVKLPVSLQVFACVPVPFVPSTNVTRSGLYR